MLSIIATPIGNLGDITLRAIETLKACDAVVCEDTRVTGNLLKQLGIPKKELVSFHSHTNPRKIEDILRRLEAGQHLALVSDAGTPGISDPGYALVATVVQCQVEWCHPEPVEGRHRVSMVRRAHHDTQYPPHQEITNPAHQFSIQVIPGPSAFLAALSASGLPINQFLYLGFLPMKKGRQTLLKSLAAEEKTMVFYESVHRIERTLNELAEALSAQPLRPVVIARELTKLHEEIIRATVADLPNIASAITKKGEFVVVIGPQER